MALRSDAYQLSDDFRVLPHPEASVEALRIELDAAYFGHIDRFEERFAAGAPSLRHCRRLRVRGDVYFGAGVRCRGDVLVESAAGTTTRVHDGAALGEGAD